MAASPPPPLPSPPLSYGASGVDYGRIDPLKLAAQRAALATGAQLDRHGFSEVESSRGESAYVVDVGPFYLASIVECLGSKALVADAMAALTGASNYADIAQDTIAMAVNDLITVGATPLVVQAYWAAGGSDWFDDAARSEALVRGWQRACEQCGIAWGGGETPALAGIVESGRVDLAAACTGIVSPKTRLSLGEHLAPGDAIVLLASSGIHANGLSLARQVAERLPRGYLAPVVDSAVPISFGEALLAPTVLYAPITEALFHAGIRVRYAVNVTGHGWRKLMRHRSDFTYRIDRLPEVPAVLSFLQREAGLDARTAYATFNMGAGFAVFVPAEDAARAVAVARKAGVEAWLAGRVESGPRRLVIEPLGVEYAGDELGVRL
ncbi:MAG TPA: AIR synthase-related protein [Caldimonas sp.]|nr:AIR synthase-related protein [Caldimonas sp.]HEX4235100.1 AIR synthase-related protein [Caldimonas sp.]